MKLSINAIGGSLAEAQADAPYSGKRMFARGNVAERGLLRVTARHIVIRYITTESASGWKK